MKKCASCQADLADNTRFCMKCGTPNPDYRPEAPPAEATQVVPPPGSAARTVSTTAAGMEKTEMIGDAGTQTGPGEFRTEVIGADQRTEVIPTRLGMTADQPEPPLGTTPPQPASPTASVPEAALRTSVPGSKEEISKIFETSGVCPNCYAPLKKGSTQCDECGYRLTGNYCASCGKAVEDGAQYCPHCKTAVSAAPPTIIAPPGHPGGGTSSGISAPTVSTPAAGGSTPLGATIVTGPPPPLGATVIAAPPSSLGATTFAEPPPSGAVPAPAPRKGFPVILVLVLAFVFLIIVGAGGWAVWKFVISKPAVTTTTTTGGTESTTGAGTTTTGTTSTQTGFPGGESGGFETTQDLIGDAERSYANGDYTQALELVERHLQTHKGDSGAYGFAAKICRQLGKTDDAKNYLLTALSYAPDNPEFHLELGKLYSNSGFADKAVEQYREALRLAPGNEEAAWLLAKEFERLGDKENARKAAEQYVQNFPSGQFRSEAETMLANRGKTNAGSGRPDSTTTASSSGSSTGQVKPPPPPPPPPPSPYVDIVLDGTALSLPGMMAGVDIMIGGTSRKFSSGANMRLDNIEKGSQQYTVRVTYYNASTNEQETTYSGSGMIDIRYPNQKVYVKRIGDRVVLQ
jgi:tetratricopeptide (TPR) repeat protein/ribosomal protein L40E